MAPQQKKIIDAAEKSKEKEERKTLYSSIQKVAYTYRRSKLGRKRVFAEFPNVDQLKEGALARKFMEYSYMFPIVLKRNMKYLVKYPQEEWENALKTFDKFTLDDSLFCHRHLRHKSRRGIKVARSYLKPDVLIPSLMMFGVSEENAKTVCEIIQERILHKFDVERLVSMAFTFRKCVMPMYYANPESIIIWHTEYYKNVCKLQSLSTSGDVTNPPASAIVRDVVKFKGDSRRVFGRQLEADGSGQLNSEDEEEKDDEKWHSVNLRRQLVRDFWSKEVNTIWFNRAYYGKSTQPHFPNVKTVPCVAQILAENLRHAYFHQDWKLVAKMVEGFSIEVAGYCPTYSPSAAARHRSWMLWSAGFASILRLENSVKEASTKVQVFARHFFFMFRPLCYPRRLGIEVAIWLTQEGYFLEGLEFLELMDKKRIGPHGYKRINGFGFVQPNPRIALIDFITQLIRAVYKYAVYKRNKIRSVCKEFDGAGQEHLKRSAELALSAFEELQELSSHCDAEITTYLPQLMELTVACRGQDKAKEVFDEIIVKHYGNHFVERQYLKFLSKYFKEQKTEICEQFKLKRKFKFETPSRWQNQKRNWDRFRSKTEKELEGGKVSFQKIPNPGFSW